MSIDNTKDILFIINPKAGDGKAFSNWTKARGRYGFLPKNPVDVTREDIKKIIFTKKPKKIAIGGGDGTVNAVVGVVSEMKKKPDLCIIPLGFGNALSYCLGAETIDKAIEVITDPSRKITIDLMKTNIKEHEIGVFNISLGYDAHIVFDIQRLRYIGIGSYVVSAVQNIFTHPENEITLTIDHEVKMTAKASSLAIANCPVIGQNYIISPNARMNDGFLDCTIFSTKYTYIRNLRLKGFKHPLYSDLGKVRFKARHIKVDGEPFLQIDGDPVVQKEGVEIEIIPSCITFLRNSDDKIDQEFLPFVT